MLGVVVSCGLVDQEWTMGRHQRNPFHLPETRVLVLPTLPSGIPSDSST